MADILTTLTDRGALRLLSTRPGGAVVLERYARGGGATRWWHVLNPDDLRLVAAELRPGSRVSLYFDRRLAELPYHPDGQRRAKECLAADGEVCFGLLSVDGLEIDMELAGGPGDLAELEETLGIDSMVFVGPFPAADDDGVNAITIVVPDADGVIRDHPH